MLTRVKAFVVKDHAGLTVAVFDSLNIADAINCTNRFVGRVMFTAEVDIIDAINEQEYYRNPKQ